MTTARYRPPLRPNSMDPALRRLAAHSPLGADDRAYLLGLGDWRSDPPGAELTAAAGPVRLLTHGWAARVGWLGNGRRQIFCFLVPGDLLGLEPTGRTAMASTVAVTAVETFDVTSLVMTARLERASPGLGRVVREAESQQVRLLLDQIVRLGRRSSFERMAHLLLDLYSRVDTAGLVSDGRMNFPLTQETLADATGLSLVHVHRVLQRLRAERLIDVRSGQLAMLEPDRLAEIANFELVRS